MNFRRGGLLIAAVLLGIALLLNRNDVQFVKQDGIQLQPISQSGIQLNSVLHLHNPNFLSSTIHKVHERFYLNGKLLGELDNEISQGIPGRKETEFPVNIRFTRDEYTSGIWADSLNLTDSLTIEGELEYNNFIGSKGTVKIQQVIPWTTAL